MLLDFVCHHLNNLVDPSTHELMAVPVLFLNVLLGGLIRLIEIDEDMLVDVFNVLMEFLILWRNDRTLIFVDDITKLFFNQNDPSLIKQQLFLKLLALLFFFLVQFLKGHHHLSGVVTGHILEAVALDILHLFYPCCFLSLNTPIGTIHNIYLISYVKYVIQPRHPYDPFLLLRATIKGNEQYGASRVIMLLRLMNNLTIEYIISLI